MPQTPVKYRVYLHGGEVFDGTTPAHWLRLRQHVLKTRHWLLAGRIYFNDGTARNFGGWSWSYLIEENGNWTIDDAPDANMILIKYLNPVLIPGGTVMEAEMQDILAASSADGA